MSLDVPRLVDGTDLIGPYQGSGYREPKYIVGRADGQVIQLPHLLFQLATLLDGQHDLDQLADRLTDDLGRGVTADQVGYLIDTKLRPAGIAAPAATAPGRHVKVDGSDPAEPVKAAQPRPDPFLALRYRAPVAPARVTWFIAGAFLPFFWPPVLVGVLASFLALDVWLVLDGGLGQIVPSATALVYEPALTLLVLGTICICLIFHEFGHAAACRYGGARPGEMGAGLYLVWPAVYTNVTDAYRLSRGGRLRTDLGGIYFNVVCMTALTALYLGTGIPWLLVTLVLLHVETLTQFLPTIRFDGYYILSDIIGLPDLFMFLVPVVKSAIPGRTPDPRVHELRPWTRWVITVWVLAVIPCLLLMLAAFLALAPQVLPVLLAVMGELLGAIGAAIAQGQTATATLGVLQVIFLVLPWFGSALVTWMIGGQIRQAVLNRRGRPAAPAAVAPRGGLAAPVGQGSPTGWFLTVLVPVLLLTGLALAAMDQRVATAGESTTAAAAASVGTDGRVPVPLTWLDAVGAHQIAALDALLPGQLAAVLDSARTILLVVALVGSLALWPVARRLGLSAPAAAVAVALCALPAPLVLLHGSVDAGVLAALWLTVAAAVAGRGRFENGVAVIAAVVAVGTAPLAAAAVLAYGAHRLAVKRPAGRWRQWIVRTGAAGLVIGAAVIGVLSLATGPLAVTGGGPVSVPLRVGAVVVGATVVAITWYRSRSLGPVATAAAVLLASAAVPGPHASTALLLAAPLLVVLVAAQLDGLVSRTTRWPGQLLLVAVVIGSIASAWPTVLNAFVPSPDPARLATWVREQVDPTQVLHVDPLTAAQLVRDGVPADQVATGPAPPGALAVVTTWPGPAGTAGDADGDLLFTLAEGPGGAPVRVYRPGAATDAATADRRLGTLLANNRKLSLAEPAAAALRGGEVDQRLMTALAGLATVRRLTIEAFPPVADEPDGAPRRSAVITEIDGVPTTEPESTEFVQRWLAAQQPPFAPATTELRDGTLVIHYLVAPPSGPPRG